MLLGAAALAILTFVTDPYFEKTFAGVLFGGKLILVLKTLSVFGIAAFITHLGRRTLVDYVDFSQMVDSAKNDPKAAGLALIAVSIYTVAFALIYTSLASYI
jgi:hypothetical protein